MAENNLLNEASDNDFDCSDDNITVTNGDADLNDLNGVNDVNDLDKLKSEVLALKMFVTEQLYFLKQSVGAPRMFELNNDFNDNSGRNGNNNDIHIKCLIEQINYLKDENRMKNSIIQSLIQTRSQDDICNDNIHKDENAARRLKEQLEEIEQIEEIEVQKSAKGVDDDATKDIKNSLDEKNITNRRKKYKNKNKKTEKVKERDEENCREDINKIKDKDTPSPKSKETVFILGDSMVKKVNGFYLTKNIRHKYLVKVRPFNSAKTRCMYDHAKPTIREMNPEHIILHVGTNDLNSEKSASHIANSIIELANSLKNDNNTIHISVIVPRNDNLNNKANEVNSRLINMCRQRELQIINHSETIDPTKHLNESNLHLNRYGSNVFFNNFKKFLCGLN